MDFWAAGHSLRDSKFTYIELRNTVGPSEIPKFRRRYVLGRSRTNMNNNWASLYGVCYGKNTVCCYGPAFAFISRLSETATVIPSRNPYNSKGINMATNSSNNDATSFGNSVFESAIENKEIKISIIPKRGSEIGTSSSNNHANRFENPVLKSTVENRTNTSVVRKKCIKHVKMNSSYYEANILGIPHHKYILWRFLFPLTAMRHLKRKEKILEDSVVNSDRKDHRRIHFAPEVTVLEPNGCRIIVPICDSNRESKIQALRQKFKELMTHFPRLVDSVKSFDEDQENNNIADPMKEEVNGVKYGEPIHIFENISSDSSEIVENKNHDMPRLTRGQIRGRRVLNFRECESLITKKNSRK